VGSSTIQSTNGQPLAVVVNEVRADGAAMAYSGLTGGADRLVVPLIFKRYNGWDSGIQLYNLSNVSGPVQVRYDGLNAPVTESVPITANGTITISPPSNAQLPTGYSGAAIITGPPGSRLVGLVNQVKSGSRQAMNYAIGPSGATSPLVTVPLVADNADGWTTGLQVEQPGGLATGLALTFFDASGAPVLRMEDSLSAGESRTYYPPSIVDIPSGFRGSAVIQSTTGLPLTVVVNEMTR